MSVKSQFSSIQLHMPSLSDKITDSEQKSFKISPTLILCTDAVS